MRSGLQHQYARYHIRPVHNLASMTCKKLHTDPMKIVETPSSLAVSRCNGGIKISRGVSTVDHFWIISTPKFGFQYTAGPLFGYIYAIRYRGSFYSISYANKTVRIIRLNESHNDIMTFVCDIPRPIDAADALKKVFDYKLDQLLLNVLLCRNPDYKYEQRDTGLLTHVKESDL